MKQKLHVDTWARKEHFLFFKQFDDPFYGVTVKLDCTKAYRFAKEKETSFFFVYHASGIGRGKCS